MERALSSLSKLSIRKSAKELNVPKCVWDVQKTLKEDGCCLHPWHTNINFEVFVGR